MGKTELRLELRARLLKRGLTLLGWGKQYGLGKGYVSAVLRRYLGEPKRPKGPKFLMIIEGLEAETGLTLCG